MKSTNQLICNYIIENWLGDSSNRAFAIAHNIDEKTVRQIRAINKIDYSITIKSLEAICTAENLSLHEFFEKIGK